MKYLVLLTPAAGKQPEEFGPHMVPEVKAVWAAYARQSLREIYFQPNPPVVSLVYELADATALEAELAALPLIEAGLLDHQVVQLGPFSQFQVLFDKNL